MEGQGELLERLELSATSPETQARLEALLRLATLGRCVGGVAHDLNNALGAISAYAELLTMSGNLGAESKRMTGEILRNVQRSTELLRFLTQAARTEAEGPEEIAVGRLVQQTVALRLHALRAAQIRVETEIAEPLPDVVAHRAAVQLALMELIVNAEDGLGHAEQKVLRLSAQRVPEGVEISVRHTGPAIPAEMRKVMFEPFYTNKSGPHTGMGLNWARRSMEGQGGRLEYDEVRGFVLSLPIAQA